MRALVLQQILSQDAFREETRRAERRVAVEHHGAVVASLTLAIAREALAPHRQSEDERRLL